jgi:hypothetical protein
MQDKPTLEEMAAALEASGTYKILRRLVPRTVSAAALSPTDKIASSSTWRRPGSTIPRTK